MLEDPDALMANPEIQKIIAEGAKSSEIEVLDGESAQDTVERRGAKTDAVTGTNGRGERAGDLFGYCQCHAFLWYFPASLEFLVDHKYHGCACKLAG